MGRRQDACVTPQALILAGGRGTRLGGLTRDLPKPMLAIGDKPFLYWLMDILSRHGIRDFILSIGYLAEKIQSYFGDGHRLDWRIRYSIEEKPLGTGGALQKAKPLLGETFLVLNGDNYLPLDYQDFISKFLAKPKAVGQIACWRNTRPSVFRSNLTLDEKTHRILSYDYENSEGKTHMDSGVKIFSQKVFPFLSEKESFSLEIETQSKLAKRGLLGGYPILRPPLEIGTPEGLKEARRQLLKKEKPAHA